MMIEDFEDRLMESALAIQDAWEPEFFDLDNPTEQVPIPVPLLLALQEATDEFVRATQGI